MSSTDDGQFQERDPVLEAHLSALTAAPGPAMPPMPDEPPGQGEPVPDNVVPLFRRPQIRVLLAAAAVLLVVLGLPRMVSDPLQTRGGGSAQGDVVVTLRLAVSRGGQSVELTDGATAALGERIFFQVSAVPPGEVEVRLEGPEGEELIQALPASEVPAALMIGTDTLAYELDAPGEYRFIASSGDSKQVRTIRVAP